MFAVFLHDLDKQEGSPMLPPVLLVSRELRYLILQSLKYLDWSLEDGCRIYNIFIVRSFTEDGCGMRTIVSVKPTHEHEDVYSGGGAVRQRRLTSEAV